MGHAVAHFEVLGKDAKLLQDFYSNAFGWTMKLQGGGYAMAHPGAERGISGGVGPAMDGGPGHVTFYLEVPELGPLLEKIGGLGGKTVLPPLAVPGGPTIAMFADPEGHVVGLVQARPGQ